MEPLKADTKPSLPNLSKLLKLARDPTLEEKYWKQLRCLFLLECGPEYRYHVDNFIQNPNKYLKLTRAETKKIGIVSLTMTLLNNGNYADEVMSLFNGRADQKKLELSLKYFISNPEKVRICSPWQSDKNKFVLKQGTWIEEGNQMTFKGHAMFTWNDGNEYIGGFERGMRSSIGIGKMWFNGGACYNGQWQDDRMHGEGRIKWKLDEMVFHGTFDRGGISGMGIYLVRLDYDENKRGQSSYFKNHPERAKDGSIRRYLYGRWLNESKCLEEKTNFERDDGMMDSESIERSVDIELAIEGYKWPSSERKLDDDTLLTSVTGFEPDYSKDLIYSITGPKSIANNPTMSEWRMEGSPGTSDLVINEILSQENDENSSININTMEVE